MRLISHGGWCCGISTIYGFDYAPDHCMAPKRQNPNAKPAANHGQVTILSDQIAFPKQTAAERVKAYCDYVASFRPKGLIEAVLTNGKFNYSRTHYDPQPQIDVWGPVLEALGFVPVTSFVNSNSGYTVTVYHLAYGQ